MFKAKYHIQIKEYLGNGNESIIKIPFENEFEMILTFELIKKQNPILELKVFETLEDGEIIETFPYIYLSNGNPRDVCV